VSIQAEHSAEGLLRKLAGDPMHPTQQDIATENNRKWSKRPKKRKVDATAQRYGIQNLPDTFLIDRQGRVAAAYTAGLVDKSDLEANIMALLSEH
jgi:cytochrome oxidase Cu insertion factor (SCO1/SenC/PrrC family)